jgi:hypothetical protein
MVQNAELPVLSEMMGYSTRTVTALTTESDKMSSSIWGRQSSSLLLMACNEASEKISGCLWRSWTNNIRSCSLFSAVLGCEDSDSRSVLASSLITVGGVSDEHRIVARRSRTMGLLTLVIQDLKRSQGGKLKIKYRPTNGFRSGTKNLSEPVQPRAVEKVSVMPLIKLVGLSQSKIRGGDSRRADKGFHQ